MMYKNCVRNEHLDLIQKKVMFPAASIHNALGAGAPTLNEVGTSGIGAIRFEDVNDEVDFIWTPSDLDNRHPLFIRYLWTSDYATSNGTCTFLTTYRSMTAGSPLAAATTALSVPHPVSTKNSATALATYWSKYGIVAPSDSGSNAFSTFSPYTINLVFRVKASAVTGITIATDFVYLLAAEISYTPRITYGDSGRKARIMADNLMATMDADLNNDVL